MRRANQAQSAPINSRLAALFESRHRYRPGRSVVNAAPARAQRPLPSPSSRESLRSHYCDRERRLRNVRWDRRLYPVLPLRRLDTPARARQRLYTLPHPFSLARVPFPSCLPARGYYRRRKIKDRRGVDDTPTFRTTARPITLYARQTHKYMRYILQERARARETERKRRR